MREQGWLVAEAATVVEGKTDPYLPWRIRAALASEFIPDSVERFAKLAIAMRHIARHRGWRNPWTPVAALLETADSSDFFIEMQERFAELANSPAPFGHTPAQLIAEIGFSPDNRIRSSIYGSPSKKDRMGILGTKLHQSDYSNEIRTIAEMQQLDDEVTRDLIRYVFKSESPKQDSSARAGRDPINPKLPRASKAHPAFQRYRIVSLLMNLRVKGSEDGSARPLTREELNKLAGFLGQAPSKITLSWADVAKELGVDRGLLAGTATQTDDGERSSARPPVDETDQRMRTSTIKTVRDWWVDASDGERSALVSYITGDNVDISSDADSAVVDEFLQGLSESDMAKLEELKLPAGRAAYSADTLTKITNHMLLTGDDLHTARMAVFELPADWQPPADPIAKPVGNPAVDRVLQIVGRWLHAMENTYGSPDSVNIEHVRDAFVSEKSVRELNRANERRYQNRLQTMSELASQEFADSAAEVRRSDVLRYRAFKRQSGACLYCGDQIQFRTLEIDHIVPRKGLGSTNTRTNLAAVCQRCNRSKSNIPFAVWAANSGIPGVSISEAQDRVKHFLIESGDTKRTHDRFCREITMRLTRTTADEAIDARSMESVAWMADELRRRIEYHYRQRNAETSVAVFRGAITAQARRAAGIDKQMFLLGGTGKTRFDRRHHAIDAAVIALMRQFPATVLAERIAIRNKEQITRAAETWKTHAGGTPALQAQYRRWESHMTKLVDLLAAAIDQDRIVVRENLRLRLSDGKAHDDTVRPLLNLPLSAEIPASLVDRAATPALWCALTRLPGFDEKSGLPENRDRKITVNGRRFTGEDTIGFFNPKGTAAAAILVRDGAVEIGDSIHHARIYRIPGKKDSYAMLRVFAADLLRHQHSDLFTVGLLPQSISRRTADTKLRKALKVGTAEYLGWVVTGDELVIDPLRFSSGTDAVAKFLREYPSINRWVLDGFASESKLRIRPRYLAAEGLEESSAPSTKSTVDSPGWRVSVNSLFGKSPITIVRRDSLGRPRFNSAAHLPICWVSNPGGGNEHSMESNRL